MPGGVDELRDPVAAERRGVRGARVVGAAWLVLVSVVCLGASLTRTGSFGAPAVASGWRIDPNTATAAELELLPRVGPALAGRIVESREADGAFGSLADLDRVRGIGPRTLELVEPYVEFRE